jgi:hypothetical protein
LNPFQVFIRKQQYGNGLFPERRIFFQRSSDCLTAMLPVIDDELVAQF